MNISLERALKAHDRLISSTPGFMPKEEGLALAESLYKCEKFPQFPAIEIGSYQGLSTIYLGSCAKMKGGVLITIDHHRGSEENQFGWDYHDPNLIDPVAGKMDTLTHFRRTIDLADLTGSVVTVISDSQLFAKSFGGQIGFLFIDGGHGSNPAHSDYNAWVPKLVLGGTFAIHDVFEDPEKGGRPPYELYLRSLEDGFIEAATLGSLKIMTKVSK